jgi:caspase domain-containing protein
MEEIFKRFLDVLPIPLLVGVGAVVGVAWLLKQLRPNSEYGDVLRDKTFRRASLFIVAIVLMYLGARYIWLYVTAVDFRPGERGIYVAEFKDDKDDIVQRHVVELIRTLIANDPLLSSVRIEPYHGIPSSDAEARRLADRHHAAAIVWGTVISESEVHMVSFEVTPRDEHQGIRKFCPKYPEIGDFTEPLVAFVKTSVPVASSRQEDAQNSYMQQQFQELRGENQRLSSIVDRLQRNIDAMQSQPSITHGGGNTSDTPTTEETVTKKRRFGIFIGINNYASLGSQLMFPSNDARAMADAFRAGSSLQNTVVTLIDASATREHVLSSMEDIARQVQPGDQVWLYFAGIGFQYGSEPSSYLALAGTQARSLQAGSLSSDELIHWVKDLKAKQVLLLIDACYSGGMLHRGISVSPQPSIAYRELMEKRGGRVLIAAGQADQLAFEDAKLGHGIFTYYLLQGLTGAADFDRDGYITAMELSSYVTSEVAGHSSGRAQVPYTSALGTLDAMGDLVVAEIKSSKSTVTR